LLTVIPGNSSEPVSRGPGVRAKITKEEREEADLSRNYDRALMQALESLEKDEDLARATKREKDLDAFEKPWMKRKRIALRKKRWEAFDKVNLLSNWIKYDLGRFHPNGDPKLKFEAEERKRIAREELDRQNGIVRKVEVKQEIVYGSGGRTSYYNRWGKKVSYKDILDVATYEKA
jgi:hypothetical protein